MEGVRILLLLLPCLPFLYVLSATVSAFPIEETFPDPNPNLASGGHLRLSLSNKHVNNDEPENPSTTRFREYLRLKAVHPNPDYNSSLEWIKKQAEEIGLPYQLHQFDPPNGFVAVLTFEGSNSSLPSILLSSHVDVVPVEEDKWTHNPWGAEKDANGNIYGRGSQDMKSVGVQYLEAVRRFKAKGIRPLRNVYIVFCSDEEIVGPGGIKYFVKMDEFKKLNVGFALDEGTASPDNKFFLTWTERAIWQVEFIAEGQAGHGSILHNNTAAEKIAKVIDQMLELREGEKRRLEENGLDLGEVTTINLTVMKGGTQVNVVPSELSVSFDIRISTHWNLSFVQELLENVTRNAGPGVRLNYFWKQETIQETSLTNNVWYDAVLQFASEFGVQIYPTIMPGATDIKYLREVGIPAFGFSPMNNLIKLAHDHDEYIPESTFLRGIDIYEDLLPRFFNMRP